MFNDIIGLPHVSINTNESKQPSDANDAIDSVLFLEATFVDDECMYMCAKSPAELDVKIDGFLSICYEVSDMFNFKFKWKPGKTECMIVYRGKKLPTSHAGGAQMARCSSHCHRMHQQNIL